MVGSEIVESMCMAQERWVYSTIMILFVKYPLHLDKSYRQSNQYILEYLLLNLG